MTETPPEDAPQASGLFGRTEQAATGPPEPAGLPGALGAAPRQRRPSSWSAAADRALAEEAERIEQTRRAELARRALEAERDDGPIPINTDGYTGPELLTEAESAEPDADGRRRSVVLAVAALVVAAALAAIFFWPGGDDGPTLTPIDELADNEFDTILPANPEAGAIGGEEVEVRVVVSAPNADGVVELLVTLANTGVGSVALDEPQLLVSGPEPTRVAPPSGSPLELRSLEPGETVQGHLAWRVSPGSTNGRISLSGTPVLSRTLPVF